MSAYIFLASETPLEEVWEPSERPVFIDLDRETTEGGAFDSNFSVLHTNAVLELSTDKPCFASLEIYKPGCEAEIVEYLKTQLESAHEIEIWHTWLNGDFDHKIRKVEIPANRLIPEDIQELKNLEVYREPLTDYCYQITGGEHYPCISC